MRINPKLIEEGYINVQKHPTLDYYIYNYSHLAQIKGHWVEDTRRARGLILDGQGNVIARPFPKFHNIEEYGKDSKLGELPSYSTFQVFEKMDGSLGIAYPDADGKYSLATRGSFVSTQAIEGTRILRAKYPYVKFQPQYTYLFEIIYPENRIVLDYGTMHDIILLAIIDNHNGKDLDYTYVKEFAEANKLTVVKSYTSMSNFFWRENLQDSINKEGYVILFDNGLRVKFKFEEYKLLHKMIFGLSTKSIWEALRGGENIYAYLAGMPDEFHKWGNETANRFVAEWCAIETYCMKIISRMNFLNLNSMKDIAEYFKSTPYPSVLFAMYKNKSYEDIIWKMIEPEYKRPFSGEEDET